MRSSPKGDPAKPAGRVGEFGWGGAASTHFWLSPADDLIVLALSQFMPYSDRLERTVKPLVYESIADTPEPASGVSERAGRN